MTHTYDALGRLVKSEHAGSVNHNMVEAVTYDAAGNRTNVTVNSGQVIVLPLIGFVVVPLGSGT